MAGMQKTKGGDRGGEEVDGKGEADPRVWQARLTLSIFIPRGTGKALRRESVVLFYRCKIIVVVAIMENHLKEAGSAESR